MYLKFTLLYNTVRTSEFYQDIHFVTKLCFIAKTTLVLACTDSTYTVASQIPWLLLHLLEVFYVHRAFKQTIVNTSW